MNTTEKNPADLLQNKEMIQLAIGVYQVIFAFEDDVTVTVESHFSYRSDSTVFDWLPGEIHLAAKAVQLLGSKVRQAHKTDDGDLHLSFSNGEVLTITRAKTGFESYQVTGNGITIVV